jgi:hypothetical protein
MPVKITNPNSNAMAGGSHGILARTYFKVKPFIPKSVRWVIRRSRTSRIMKQSADVWPIQESASAKPAGWKGWPHGKKFALVFTHDVESRDGVGKVKDLAKLERRHGLCSSFNFIPEGPYEDPTELRRWLVKNGFEVGVHDLNHDGQLYESREGFSRKAELINNYLEKWDAVGFRSGFMLHQLDWLHDLNVVYDASTFDTDPFEPQPDGSATIFPFLVKPSDGGTRPGYVELSYTLPQDSTLFILLRERTPEIWQRKLDWVARHGGLALVNIHPDYINFSGESDPALSYPVNLLKEFLGYCLNQYGNDFWNPLPRELAWWYRNEIEPLNPVASKATTQNHSYPPQRS